MKLTVAVKLVPAAWMTVPPGMSVRVLRTVITPAETETAPLLTAGSTAGTNLSSN